MKIRIVVDDLELAAVECENILDGLQQLHEKLNDIANPRAAALKPFIQPTATIPTIWTDPICSCQSKWATNQDPKDLAISC
jgi:hypothetical protein